MRRKLKLIITLILISISFSALSLTNLFYSMRDNDVPHLRDHYRVLNDIKKHHQKIDILIPQAYVINPEGVLYKFVEPETAQATKKYNIKLMPLVTNEDFNANKVNRFLQNKTAEQRAIDSLVTVCKQKKYYGFQIDFEHLPERDRTLFTEFYQGTANALHHAGCKVSIAIVPARQSIPVSDVLLKRDIYWAGAYDQKQIGKVSDFVVLMTYNQHGAMTPPGPNAGYALDKKAVEHALKNIPKQKVFLGIPTTSNYWTMAPIDNTFKNIKMTLNDKPISPDVAQAVAISYEQVKLLQKKHHLKWLWDKQSKVHYAMFDYQDFYRYVFIEDAASFAAKRQLAKQYHLGGIAVFRLGTEDHNIWGRPSQIQI